MIKQADVIIIGGGPVGISMGNLLGLYGIKTLIFEKEDTFYTYPRVAVVDDEVLRSFQIMDMAKEQLADMIPGLFVEIYARSQRKLMNARLPEDYEFGFTRLAGILQQVVEEKLRRGLDRFSCVELHLKHNLEAFSQTSQGVTVTLSTEDGSKVTAEAQYLLGCDGGRSTVRKLANIRLIGPDTKDQWLIIDFIDKKPPLPIIRAFGTAERAAISVPLAQNYQRMEFRLLPEEDPQSLENDIEKIHKLMSPWFAPEDINIVRRRVYSQSAKIAESFQDNRIFLLGDAAHLMPPFTGQGLCSGIRDATNLAWKLSLVLRNLAGKRLLASYETERKPHAQETIDGAQMMGLLLFPKDRRQEFIRDTTLTILNSLPPARRLIEKVKPRPICGTGAFINDGVAGFMFRQPTVVTQNGTTVLLDEVLGKGFSILGFNLDPTEVMHRDTQAFWHKVGVKIVKVLPKGQKETFPQAFVSIEDHTNVLEKWFRQHENLVVLRPDHYIAFTCSASQLDYYTEQFCQLI